MSNLLRVGVVFGGQSGEHEVSILSARSIIKNIDQTKYQPLPIYIDKQGTWHTDSQITKELLTCDEQWLLSQRRELSKYPQQLDFRLGAKERATGVYKEVHEDCERVCNNAENSSAKGNSAKLSAFNEQDIDVVFPVLHGTFGEDGTIQGLFEILNLPYVGADVMGSALGMDKELTKRLAASAGIPICKYLVLNEVQWLNDQKGWLKRIEEALSFPVFIKPARLGSSVGVSKSKNTEQLKQAITEAFIYDNKILVEKAIRCREIELAVLANLDPIAAPLVSLPGEIIPTHEFYSYEAKYIDPNGAKLVLPAELTQKQNIEAQSIAQRAFTALACQDMARVDLFWDEDNKQFLFNELNTIPGFTKISMYPKLITHMGIDYPQLITHLLQLAMIRHQKRRKQYF